MLTAVPGTVGGSESAARSLLNEFAASEASDRITVIANSDTANHYADLESNAVHVQATSFTLGSTSAGRAASIVKSHLLPRLVLRRMPEMDLDVLHYPLTVPIPRIPGVPSVVTLYDVQHEELPELFSRAERMYRDWIYRAAAVKGTIVATSSSYSRETIIRHYGIPTERVCVIPLGVDLDRFSAIPKTDDEQISSSLNVPDRFIFYPANLWRHKNHQRLLEALAHSSIPHDLHLVLTGATYGRLDELRHRSKELGVDGRVHHLGYVSSDTLPVLYRRATALVFPSLFEGFGQPLLEAAASGCPVATSRGGTTEEVAGNAAVYFDPHDPGEIATAVAGIVDDQTLNAELRDRGAERAREFSWARTAALYRDAYAEAAKKSLKARTM